MPLEIIYSAGFKRGSDTTVCTLSASLPAPETQYLTPLDRNFNGSLGDGQSCRGAGKKLALN